MIIKECFPICDRCGESFADMRYGHAYQVRQLMKNEGWKVIKGKDVCDECVRKEQPRERRGKMKDEELYYKLEPKGCWHEWIKYYADNLECGDICKYCGERNDPFDNWSANPDFTTWEGFGWLWGKCIEKDWWPKFIAFMLTKFQEERHIKPGEWSPHTPEFITWMFTEDRFRDTLKEYFEELEDV